MASPAVCMTPMCIHAASNILWHMPVGWENMDPCSDFYQMVCGGTADHEEKGFTAAGDSTDQNRWILRNILENEYKPNYKVVISRSENEKRTAEAEKANHAKLKAAYDTCMDEKAREKTGVEPLRRMFAHLDSPKVWPVDETEIGKLFDPKDKVEFEGFIRAMVYLNKAGVELFFDTYPYREDTTVNGVGVVNSLLSKDTKRLYIGPAEATLKRLRNAKATTFAEMEKLLETSIKKQVQAIFTGDDLYSGNLTSKEAGRFADQIVKLEIDLVKAALAPAPEKSKKKNRLTSEVNVTEIATAAPNLAIPQYLRGILPPGTAVPDVVIADRVDYLAKVSELLLTHTVPTIQMWMFYKTVVHFGREVRHPKLADFKPKYKIEDWEVCVNSVSDMMPHALAAFYVKAVYSESLIQTASNLMENVRAAFKKRLDQLTWMSDKTRQYAAKKADEMYAQIGYNTEPVDMRNPVAMQEYYKDLRIDGTTSHIDNFVNAAVFKTNKDAGAINELTRHGNDPGDAPYTSNAMHVPARNSIAIFFGYMRLPWLSNGTFDAINYGALGSVCGHELIHGFDDNGHKHDADGLLNNWWDDESLAQFENRTKCFTAQYDKYEVEVPGGKFEAVSGNRTLGENLADAGGLGLAFEAWKAASKEGQERLLPGLEKFDTPAKQFFLAYGAMRCAAPDPEKTLDMIRTDPHAPHPVRIQGATANSRAFRETFNCPVKQPTCELW